VIHPAKAIMVAEIILSPACGLHNLSHNQKQGAAFSANASYTRTNKNRTDGEEVFHLPDYAKMYRRLFNSQTDVIEILQRAQRETEEMYVSAPDPDIRVLDSQRPEGDGGTEEI
jgi:hypothetical protein